MQVPPRSRRTDAATDRSKPGARGRPHQHRKAAGGEAGRRGAGVRPTAQDRTDEERPPARHRRRGGAQQDGPTSSSRGPPGPRLDRRAACRAGAPRRPRPASRHDRESMYDDRRPAAEGVGARSRPWDAGSTVRRPRAQVQSQGRASTRAASGSASLHNRTRIAGRDAAGTRSPRTTEGRPRARCATTALIRRRPPGGGSSRSPAARRHQSAAWAPRHQPGRPAGAAATERQRKNQGGDPLCARAQRSEACRRRPGADGASRPRDAGCTVHRHPGASAAGPADTTNRGPAATAARSATCTRHRRRDLRERGLAGRRHRASPIAPRRLARRLDEVLGAPTARSPSRVPPRSAGWRSIIPAPRSAARPQPRDPGLQARRGRGPSPTRRG